MDPRLRVFVAGHRGLVGSALVRRLERAGWAEVICRDRSKLDLSDYGSVLSFLRTESIDQVYMAAGKVGGIRANSTYPADFTLQNLKIASAVTEACFNGGVEKLLYFGSSCIYPRDCRQPIKEDYLLSGPLEPTNAGYAIAKIQRCSYVKHASSTRCYL